MQTSTAPMQTSTRDDETSRVAPVITVMFALIALGLNTALAVTIVYAILQYLGCG